MIAVPRLHIHGIMSLSQHNPQTFCFFTILSICIELKRGQRGCPNIVGLRMPLARLITWGGLNIIDLDVGLSLENDSFNPIGIANAPPTGPVITVGN
jgi:hypothetical protein